MDLTINCLKTEMHKQTNTSTNTTNCQLWAIDSGDFDQKYESPSPEFPKDWAVTDMGCAGFHCVAKYIFKIFYLVFICSRSCVLLTERCTIRSPSTSSQRAFIRLHRPQGIQLNQT